MNILSYQGNKTKLLPQIDAAILETKKKGKFFLDIFGGTGSVANSVKGKVPVWGNDIEYYSYCIISSRIDLSKDDFSPSVTKDLLDRINNLNEKTLSFFESDISKEDLFLKTGRHELIDFYLNFGTVFSPNENFLERQSKLLSKPLNFLFVLYYSTTYFGLRQSIAIDSIRNIVLNMKDSPFKMAALSALFYAMNKSVFSKDGHMAQPLSQEKYFSRMLQMRTVDIISEFSAGLSLLEKESSAAETRNRVTNLDFHSLIAMPDFKMVGNVYADPPYTDMQYSRYYHLLNTACHLNYPTPTKSKNGYTKGLYCENRDSSLLSRRGTCLKEMEVLMMACKNNQTNLLISFAYPENVVTEKSDRYVMKIDDLIRSCQSIFSSKSVEVRTVDYFHSNQRNKTRKAVKEYIIICKA